MAPEYAFDGQFSVKSDAFSYGILLLEIISGKKSRGFCHLNAQNLIAYVSSKVELFTILLFKFFDWENVCSSFLVW